MLEWSLGIQQASLEHSYSTFRSRGADRVLLEWYVRGRAVWQGAGRPSACVVSLVSSPRRTEFVTRLLLDNPLDTIQTHLQDVHSGAVAQSDVLVARRIKKTSND